MKIINGAEIAANIRERLKKENEADGLSPGLAIVLVGDNKESLIYTGLKERAVEYVGGRSRLLTLPAESSREEVLAVITDLNRAQDINGIILQLPLPDKLSIYQEEFLQAIDPAKDVDGFNPVNRGKLTGFEAGFISCSALAAMQVIELNRPELAGKHAVLLGDSFDLIFSLAVLLIKKGCQVTIIPEYKPDTRIEADIIVAEKGGPGIINSTHIRPGTLLIDAGFYYRAGQVCGNIKGDSFKDAKGLLLPVPGGLGPVLIAKLLENLCLAARGRKSL